MTSEDSDSSLMVRLDIDPTDVAPAAVEFKLKVKKSQSGKWENQYGYNLKKGSLSLTTPIFKVPYFCCFINTHLVTSDVKLTISKQMKPLVDGMSELSLEGDGCLKVTFVQQKIKTFFPIIVYERQTVPLPDGSVHC